VVSHVKPTVLIGVSGQPGLFSQSLIEEMAAHCEQPIIFPLSNPSKRVEATPEDIIRWTQGRALIATGSPFATVEYEGRRFPIAQCNNSYIFPGIGLAVLASGIRRLTNEMMMVASEVLASVAPAEGALLPPLKDVAEISKQIAFSVAREAQQQGLAPVKTAVELKEAIEDNFWSPRYREYKRISI
jgi:malate dehydrogenase (oxaloacetate-decarboxylating)